MKSITNKKIRQYSKSFFAVVLTIVAILGTVPFGSFAIDEENSSIYEEKHDQINFDNLFVAVADGERLIVDIDQSLSPLKKLAAKKQLDKYESYVETHSNAEEELLDSINSDEYICAISYTDAPVVWVEDHFERVLKDENSSATAKAASTDKTKKSDASKQYNLTMKTSVTRTGTKSPYTYTAKTYGTWDNDVSTALNGEKLPAYGDDYISQSCPNATITSSDSFSSKYNYATNGSTDGQSGVNFHKHSGGKNWICYAVVDDPLGKAQLHTFSLTQKFKAKANTKAKKIYSYYVHTWAQMGVKISASGTAGVSGGEPTAGITLNITPTLSEKRWQLYSYVTYNW